MSKIRMANQSAIEHSEFEFESIREFSHSGAQLGANVSREERRERIRVAIMRENKQDRRWRDTPLTYAAVYQQVYGKSIDSRRPDEEEIAPMRTTGTQLWGHHASSDGSELEHADEDGTSRKRKDAIAIATPRRAD